MHQHSSARRQFLQAATLAAGTSALTAAVPAWAQETFPRRPVTMVCPWAPGGIGDTTARRLAQALSLLWNQPVPVENKTGANGNIGAAAVANAAPDGYTLVTTLDDGLVIGKAAGFPMGFDPITDLTPIARIGVSDIYWTVRGDSPYKNINEFIAYAKANPGKLNFGSNGIGSSPHLALELLNHAAGLSIGHIPFRGGAQAVPEVLAGRLDCMMATPALALQHFKAGTLRPIALVGDQRSQLFPEIKTIAESGYPDVSISLGMGLFGPKGMPKPLVDQINRDTRKVINSAEMKAKFAPEGFITFDTTPEAYQSFLVKEIARMEPLVKRLNFKQA